MTLFSFFSGDESCVSMVGRWICYPNGWWDFKVDKTRPGKSINCEKIDTFKSLEEVIRRRFSMVGHDVFVEMSYWANDVLVRLNGQETPPTEIKDDWSFRMFKSLLRSESSVNLFVTFKRMVDDKLEFLDPLEIVVPPYNRGFPTEASLLVDAIRIWVSLKCLSYQTRSLSICCTPQSARVCDNEEE
ncbi:unnamed protein product [Arabidopsis thaliana]|uniref:Uncharacterized protein n=1 Tax=Arabidopsis thaliana TaxID=3702 RepID=Q9LHE1_ARATH|nr:unnamed protein product [Arabidopsis thaliana]